jgi:hypothetical protein
MTLELCQRLYIYDDRHVKKVSTGYVPKRATCVETYHAVLKLLGKRCPVWPTTKAEVLTQTSNGLAIMKDNVITIVTNIGPSVSAMLASASERHW